MNAGQKLPLGNLTEILSGFAFKSEYFNEERGLPIVRIRDVVPGVSATRYSGDFDPAYLVDSGQILVGMDGEFNVARWRGGRALLNQRVCRIRSQSKSLDDRYLFHFLPQKLKEIEAATPYVTVKHLSVKQIRSIEIPLPSLADQHRIAAILDNIEALRAKRRAAIAVQQKLRLSLFLDLFGDPATNPRRWRLLSFDEVVQEFRYGTSNKSGVSGNPTLRIPNVVGGSLQLDDLKMVKVSNEEFGRLRLQSGDLLFVRTNGNPDFVGRCAMFEEDAVVESGFAPTEFIFASYLIRARIDSSKLLPVFVREFMLSAEGRRQLRERCKTSAGQFNINTAGLGAVRVPVPPISLQREFIARCERLETAKLTGVTSDRALETLQISLQHRAFRGEL